MRASLESERSPGTTLVTLGYSKSTSGMTLLYIAYITGVMRRTTSLQRAGIDQNIVSLLLNTRTTTMMLNVCAPDITRALTEVKSLVTSDCDTGVSKISNIVTDHVATSFQ